MSGYLDTDIEVFHLRPLMLVELSWVHAWPIIHSVWEVI